MEACHPVFAGICGSTAAVWRFTAPSGRNCLRTPALLDIARENLDRWSLAGGRSQPYWDAWREILDLPLSEIVKLLGQEDERMDALRQATPFAGVLEPRERWAIYEEFALGRSAPG